MLLLEELDESVVFYELSVVLRETEELEELSEESVVLPEVVDESVEFFWLSGVVCVSVLLALVVSLESVDEVEFATTGYSLFSTLSV